MQKLAITRKVTALFLSMTIIFGATMPSFANERGLKNNEQIVFENGRELTEEEFLEILECNQELEIVESSIAIEDSFVDSNLMYMRAGSAEKLVAEYTFYLVGFGLVAVQQYNNSVKIGEKMFAAGSKTYKKTLKAIDNFIFAKSNPTGRTVREVEKKLKKDGFEKQKNNGGSHQKWKKPGNERFVEVPNHGGGYEIAIGTLRRIWKDAGWI